MRRRSQKKKKPGTEKVLVGTRPLKSMDAELQQANALWRYGNVWEGNRVSRPAISNEMLIQYILPFHCFRGSWASLAVLEKSSMTCTDHFLIVWWYTTSTSVRQRSIVQCWATLQKHVYPFFYPLQCQGDATFHATSISMKCRGTLQRKQTCCGRELIDVHWWTQIYVVKWWSWLQLTSVGGSLK